MDDIRSLSFVNQLIEKTEQGKLPWTTAFEDGQFKAVLPGGELAFVVQVKGEVRKFLILDDRQEVIHERSVSFDEAHVANVHSSNDGLDRLYEAIGNLQHSARGRALQVDEKLAKAERLLAAI